MSNPVKWAVFVALFSSICFGYRNGDTLKIFFLGNSITGVGETSAPNRMAEFRQFAAANGIPAHITAADYGTWDFQNNPKTMSALRDTLWDYVVLQPHSYFDPQGFKPTGRLLIDTVRASGAVPVLYMIQARQSEVPVHDSVQDAWMPYRQDTINRAILELAQEKNCAVAPVGFAYKEIRCFHPEYLLYYDYIHQNNTGAYLHGAAIFSAITGVNPVGLPNLYSLDTLMLRALQCAAWKACLLDTLDSFILPWTRPLRPDSITFGGQEETLQCYFSRIFPVFACFGADSISAPVHEAIYRTLTPLLAAVDPYGRVSALALGTARIEAEYDDSRDTLSLVITANTAVFDSVRILPRRPSGYVQDGFQFQAVGYAFQDGAACEVDFTSIVTWISSRPDIFDVFSGKVQKKSALGGDMYAAVAKDGLTDTVRFSLLQDLDVLLRINFQDNDTLYNYLWKADWGLPYTDSMGYGWMDSYTRAHTAGDDIQYYDSLFLRSTAREAFRSPAESTVRVEGTYKINCRDGDYIIRMALGDPTSGDWRTGYVRFGTDTLFKHTGSVWTGRVRIKTDTIQVRGTQGMLLNLYGPICYLVVATSAGVNMDSIAYDQKPLPQYTDAPNAVVADKPGLELTAAPNPFNPALCITYSLPETENVDLCLYDSRGVRMARLVHSKKPAGIHQVMWDAAGRGQAASGIFYAVISAGSHRKTLPVVLIK